MATSPGAGIGLGTVAPEVVTATLDSLKDPEVVDETADDSEEFSVFPVVVLSPPAPVPPDVVVIVIVVWFVIVTVPGVGIGLGTVAPEVVTATPDSL